MGLPLLHLLGLHAQPADATGNDEVEPCTEGGAQGNAAAKAYFDLEHEEQDELYSKALLMNEIQNP